MKWFQKSAVLFSIKTCLAGFLALYVALELNLDKPAWSLTTAYIASQLYSASTLSKSVFRLLGTILGGLFIFLIYPITVLTPVLFSLCVSIWVAVCLYLSLHDRTPKSYVFMLAGYSAAIMGFPDVTEPLAISYTVISRIEEISVAIICSSLVHSLILPVSMRNILENSVNSWYDSAKKLCNEMLSGKPQDKALDRENLLIQMSAYPANVETLITHCIFEGDAARKLIRLVSVQYQHLSYLIPTLTSIETRLKVMAEQQVTYPEEVTATFRDFLRWLNNSKPGQDNSAETQAIQQQLTDTQQQIQYRYQQQQITTEESLLINGLLVRLGDFVRISDAYYSASQRTGRFAETPSSKRSYAHWHIDKGMLLLSSFTAFLATFLSCLFWIGTGWSDGAIAPMMAAVLCSFFAGIDNPLAPMKVFLKGVIIAIIISILYAGLLIPRAITFEALLICLAPGLFFLGLVIANPRTALVGMIIATQIPGLMGMSHHFQPNLLGIVNGSIATMIGVVAAVLVTAIIRSKRPSWIARRALRKGIKELIQFLAEIKHNHASPRSRQRFIARMIDKVNVILPRKKIDPNDELISGGNLIGEVWLGANYYDFYVKNQLLLVNQRSQIEHLSHELNLFLSAHIKSLHTPPHEELLNALDQLLLTLEQLSSEDIRFFAPMLSLFNIRLSLFSTTSWPTLTLAGS